MAPNVQKLLSTTPEKVREQKNIIRRFYFAVGGYVFAFFCVVLPGYFLGFGRDITFFQVLWYLVVPMVTFNLLFFIMFQTGINRFFQDPGLTFLQQLVGLVMATVICYYTVDAIRGACLILYIHIFYFGTFQRRRRDFYYPLIATVIFYSFLIVMLCLNHPAAIDLKTEIMRFVILLTALVWLMWLGNYLSSMRRHIQRLVVRDELTGVYNRRQLYTLLAREKALAERAGVPFTVCMMDLDDFKLVNDTYGHQAGDEVLKVFARTVQRNIRAEDYVARYGGEEFLVVLANYRCRDADDKSIQRLRQLTENLSFDTIPGFPGITVSIGVSTYSPPESIDMMIARADDALYRAKQKGKNRVEVSPDGQDV